MSKFVIEYPYNEHYNRATVYTSSDGRKTIHFRNFEKKKHFTTTLARYRMSVKLGRFLTQDEHVDHIDEDKTNDDINNLQILTPEENRRKNDKYYRDNYQNRFDFNCEVCGKYFILTEREMKMKYAQAQESRYKIWTIACSQSCSHELKVRYLSLIDDVKFTRLNKEIIDKIQYMHSLGYSGYRIAFELKISRNTVMKYIKNV